MSAELANRLRSEIAERYPAFLHNGRGSVGLRLSSADWRAVIAALEGANCTERRENRHMVITPRVVEGLQLLKTAKCAELRRLLKEDWGRLLDDDLNVIVEARQAESLIHMALYTYREADADLQTALAAVEASQRL